MLLNRVTARPVVISIRVLEIPAIIAKCAFVDVEVARGVVVAVVGV